MHSGSGGAKYTGDAAFERRDYESAIRSYDSLRIRMPNDASIYWRLARANVCLGDVSPPVKAQTLFRVAELRAREAMKLNPVASEGYSWLAAALGNIAMYEGSSRKVELSREIKRTLDTALALNPLDDIAWSILGSYFRAIGNVSWIERQLAEVFLGGLPRGGYGEAEYALQRAIDISPHVVRHHFELGLLYLDWGRKDEAKRELLRAARAPITMARDSLDKSRTAELIEELEQSDAQVGEQK